MRFLRIILAVAAFCVRCSAKKQKNVKYFQNCAARGLCDTLYEFRDKSIHDAPPGSPKGHLKPLGHPDFLDSWAGEVDSFTEPPPPDKFWKEYHNTRQPFIIKGAALQSPAINWTDKYIMDHYGDEVTKVEWRNEDRLTDYCGQNVRGKGFIHCPRDTIPYVESRTNIRNFLKKSAANPEWAKYIISQMPDGMGKEWQVPAFFNCGKRPKGDLVKGKPWMTQLYENNFWYVRIPKKKMATSTIHYDMNHQIMCMLAGKKEWIMWDLQTEEQKVPMWNNYYKHPSKGRPQGSDDSPIDGERVDLMRWPEFANAKWKNTTIEKGDCLYTPANLLHYVRSWSDDEDGRAIALMTMYQVEEKYDPKNCIAPPAYVPLSEYDTMWGEFPGSEAVPHCMNHIKMGFPNWKRTLKHLAKREVSKGEFVEFWMSTGVKYSKKKILAAWDRFSNENHVGSWAERLFSSTAISQLAKDVSCAGEGFRGPERKLKNDEWWDSRNEYSLAGGTSGYVDEKHSDL